MSAPARFSFLDEGEALRRLGVDRDTLLTLVREKRLRAYPGVGKGNFYRLRDIDALNADLHDEAVTPASAEGEAPTTGRKVFDPAYKVHVRLQADLKWYDLEDEDLKAWVREMHADGYPRQRANISAVMNKLQRLIDLMDEAAAGWQTLKADLPAPSTMSTAASTAPDAVSDTTPATGTSAGESAAAGTRPRRASLPMFSGEQTSPSLQSPPFPPPTPAETVSQPNTSPTDAEPTSADQMAKTRRKNLPIFTPAQRLSGPENEQTERSEKHD